jgi:hypothetical protein
MQTLVSLDSAITHRYSSSTVQHCSYTRGVKVESLADHYTKLIRELDLNLEPQVLRHIKLGKWGPGTKSKLV